MQVPQQLDPHEIRMVIWNGLVEVPDFGKAVPAGVKLRIVEYDTDGMIDEVLDTDHEGKECMVRQFNHEEGPSLVAICQEMYNRLADIDNGHCTVCHGYWYYKSPRKMQPCQNRACPTHRWEKALKGT